jgi:hypothetical protein
MGGHGRALENLYTTLQEFNVENDDFLVIQHEVVAKIRMAYPDIVTRLNNLERFIVHVIARKKASSLQQSYVDELLSLGLFRLRQDADLLEFPYILWLLWLSKSLPWANYTSWAPKKEEDVFATWEEWEHFNCSYRIIKSKAFGGDRVHWTDLHAGARFGPACDEIVDELALEFKRCHGHVNTASKPVGKWIGTDPCLHTNDTIGRCIQVGPNSPSGDSYLCLHAEINGWIHEVHQEKHTDHDITYKQFCVERKKSAADIDFFILFSTGKVNQEVLEVPRSAFVDASCWNQYYGPFAARAYFVKTKLPPLINDDDAEMLCLVPGVGKAFAAAILEERASHRFKDTEDAEIRLTKRKGLKNVDHCVKQFRYN